MLPSETLRLAAGIDGVVAGARLAVPPVDVSDDQYMRDHQILEIVHDILTCVAVERPSQPVRAMIDRLRQVYLPAETERFHLEQFYGVKVHRPHAFLEAGSSEDELQGGKKRERTGDDGVGDEVKGSDSGEGKRKARRPVFRQKPSMDFVDCTAFPPKSPEVERMLESHLSTNVLFKRLESSERKLVYRAFFECKYARHDVIMRAGDMGDTFYVLVDGECHAPVVVDGEEQVLHYRPGDSFGELALIHGTPRQSTLIATTDCTLWGLQRTAYRQTLMTITRANREKYFEFLQRFPWLSSLSRESLLLITDCLETAEYQDGEPIIRQGDAGEEFFLVLSGEVEVRKREVDSEREVGTLKEGDYFGEIALLTNLPRQASCIARGGPVKCAYMRREDFLRVLPAETTAKMCAEFLPKIKPVTATK